MRCAMSHDGYGCKLGASHQGDTHQGADGHTWTTEESWNYDPDTGCGCDHHAHRWREDS